MKTRIALISTNHKTWPSHLFAPIFLPFSPLRANSCNSCLLFALFAFFAVNCSATTNDLATALQKGLFEEEANHNYPAAIEAYQGVINRFDEDRKLAATAIFRVGEIYRKQGKTNEANAQYERVVREFSEQSALATLSQSYLAASPALAINASTTNANSESAPTSDEAEEVRKIRAMIRDSPDLINAKDQGGSTRLHTAAYQGHLIVARFLVENGADPNAPNNIGQTPLHCAANYGHKALAELFLSHGASVKITDVEGNTPLHDAAKKGFRSIVELLLAHGADINAKTRTGSTPLHLAVANGFKAVAEFLISHGADVNLVANETRDDQQQHIYLGPPLQIAAVRDDQPIAELLLAHKADPNVTDRAGSTPLHTTASRGNQKLTELLLANKAAVDPVNKAGETPLDLAAKSSAEITTILLAHGANVNATNAVSGAYEGWSPLIYAITSRQKEVVDILLKDKANPNLSAERYGTVSSRGFSPLVLAVWQADPDIVASMLNGKADPNLKNGSGLSPALAAITVNDASTRKRILSLLLDHGADTEARYSDDRTPLIAAVERKDKETVELLLAHKADPNAREPKSGNAALHYAVLSVSSGDLPELVPSIVETLLAAGANPNLQNGEGKTPLNYLQSPLNSVRAKIRGLLVAHGAVEDLPRLDVVEVRRPEANFSKIIFTKGTNGWDQFTLFDLIGVQYKLLTASTSGEGRVVSAPYSKFAHNSGLDFPDFTRIRIRHPKPDFKSWNERTVNVASALTSRDCSADITLEPGDEVEIPEADHIRYATWNGLPNATLESLKKCLTRRVSIIVKGQTSMITLAPDISFYKVATDNVESGGQIVQGAQTEANLKQFAPFMIMPVLTNSKLLLASSDLSRIKLLRTDKDGQKRELIVDCSEGKPAPSVWLRDGDVIEVPDKP